MTKTFAREWIILVRCVLLVSVVAPIACLVVEWSDRHAGIEWEPVLLFAFSGLLYGPLLYVVVGLVRITIAAARITMEEQQP